MSVALTVEVSMTSVPGRRTPASSPTTAREASGRVGGGEAAAGRLRPGLLGQVEGDDGAGGGEPARDLDPHVPESDDADGRVRHAVAPCAKGSV
jgi:hypothetical protein